MEQFLELFEGYLTRRVRGLAEPEAAERVPGAPLVTWAALWEKATLSGGEVEEYNLDRRQFVLDLLETSAAALRRPGTPNQVERHAVRHGRQAEILHHDADLLSERRAAYRARLEDDRDAT